MPLTNLEEFNLCCCLKTVINTFCENREMAKFMLGAAQEYLTFFESTYMDNNERLREAWDSYYKIKYRLVGNGLKWEKEKNGDVKFEMKEFKPGFFCNYAGKKREKELFARRRVTSKHPNLIKLKKKNKELYHCSSGGKLREYRLVDFAPLEASIEEMLKFIQGLESKFLQGFNNKSCSNCDKKSTMSTATSFHNCKLCEKTACVNCLVKSSLIPSDTHICINCWYKHFYLIAIMVWVGKVKDRFEKESKEAKKRLRRGFNALVGLFSN